MEALQADAALIISASHNPATDNGIKLIRAGGIKLSLEDEQRISDFFYAALQQETPRSITTWGTDTAVVDAAHIYREALVLRDGDDILCLLLSHHPAYQDAKTVVGTIMTNAGLEEFLRQQHKQLIRTPVGDKYIAEQLQRNNLMLGGEPVGHIILKNYPGIGDGVLTALVILEAALHSENWDMPTFTKYPVTSKSIKVACRTDLSQDPYQSIIQAAHAQSAPGRIIVRYSGTEPVLRIMVEAITQQTADELCSSLTVNLISALTKEPVL